MTDKLTIAMFTAALATLTVLFPALSSSSTASADDWDDRYEDYWEDREDNYEDLREAREDYYEDLYDDRDDFYVNRYDADWDDDVRYRTAGYRGYAEHGYVPAHGCCHVNTCRPAPVRVHHHHHGCCAPAPVSCCRVID